MAIELLTNRKAAELLGLSRKTLARWRWKGKGPAFRKIGRRVRYARQDLEEFIASSSASGPAIRTSRTCEVRRVGLLGHAAD